jgi:hypothetical protein
MDGPPLARHSSPSIRTALTMTAPSATLSAIPGSELALNDWRPRGGGATLQVDVGKIGSVLWLATIIVLGFAIMREVIIHVVGVETVLRDLRHFALDAERSLPAWYESLMMAAASALLAVIAALSRYRDPRNRLQWTLLAAIFILMSMDEIVSFHEITIEPMRNAFQLTGFLHFAWVILAAPVLAALALFFIPFMLRLPLRTAIRFVIAGGLFVAGAFGLEFVGGYFASSSGVESIPYKIAASCEEILEIVGMTLFVTSVLRHLAETAPRLQIAMTDTD